MSAHVVTTGEAPALHRGMHFCFSPTSAQGAAFGSSSGTSSEAVIRRQHRRRVAGPLLAWAQGREVRISRLQELQEDQDQDQDQDHVADASTIEEDQYLTNYSMGCFSSAAVITPGEFVYQCASMELTSSSTSALVATAVRSQHIRLFKVPKSRFTDDESLLPPIASSEATCRAFDRDGIDLPAPVFAVAFLKTGSSSSSSSSESSSITSSPTSSFTMTPSQVWLAGGYSRCVRIFDVGCGLSQTVATFGSPSTSLRVPRSATRGDEILAGIHGCLAPSQETPGRLAVGTYDGWIGVVDSALRDDSYSLAARFEADRDSPFRSGIAHLQFARGDQFLLVGTRHGDRVFAFDTRMLDQTRGAVAWFPRQNNSNQRMSFTVNAAGTLLATGHGDDGEVLVYDLSSATLLEQARVAPSTVNACSFFSSPEHGSERLAISYGHRRRSTSRYEEIGESESGVLVCKGSWNASYDRFSLENLR